MKCVRCGQFSKVLETRTDQAGMVLRRRRECDHCGHKFSSYEIDDGLAETLKKYLGPHLKAVRKKQELFQRNEKILAKLRAGDKHAVVAAEFGLSDNMVSTIARRAGVPAYARQRGLR
jgi:transcriptional regulator NrdR family protein